MTKETRDGLILGAVLLALGGGIYGFVELQPGGSLHRATGLSAPVVTTTPLSARDPAKDGRAARTGEVTTAAMKVLGGRTEADLARIYQLGNAGDETGLKRMALQGQAVLLDEGTQVRVLGGVSPVEVRVESGPHAGKSCFVGPKALAQP